MGFLKSVNERSAEAVRQILLSGLARGVTIVCALLIVPLTIDYVNPTRYGIWLTLSSIIAWFNFLDFGLGHGFRNKFAEAKANRDFELASQYVSTAYFAITVIVVVLFVVFCSLNSVLSWNDILRIDESYLEELQMVLLILAAFFCLNMIVNIFTIMLTADQKSGVAAWVNAGGQVLSLLVIWLLTRLSEGDLIKLALYFSGVPCLLTLVVSIFVFSATSYRKYRPRIKNIRFTLVRSILSLGVEFFVISLCLLVIFQFMNLILMREVGADAVTEYGVAFKYFNVLYTIVLIIITPFWSAFTDAYTLKDYQWMSKIIGKLELIYAVVALVGVAMLFLSGAAYKIWIGDSIVIPFQTSVAVLIYVLALTVGNVYMYMINGIGTVRIQLLIYVIIALFAWPVMVIMCRRFGVAGVVVVPSFACLLQALFGKIQLNKIISGTAKGLWLK